LRSIPRSCCYWPVPNVKWGKFDRELFDPSFSAFISDWVVAEMPRDSHSQDYHEAREEDPVDLKDRLEYLNLSEADIGRLRTLLPGFRATAEEFAGSFYRHLLRFDETAKFLQDPELVERLKVLQQEHFESVLQAEWDDQFVERRRRVGQVHAERGIGHLLFLGAYFKFVEHILNSLENDGDNAGENREKLASVFKVVFLDIGLTLESYFSRLSRELRQALDIIWRANNQLRQFARLASHDLKTPLGTVANLCDEVLDEFHEDLPEESVGLIQSARRTAFRMSNTIDELLSSTLETDVGNSESVSLLTEVMHEAVDRVQPGLKKKGIEILIPPNLPEVHGNRIQLREAFYNLLSNAEKYIEQKPGQIEIRFEVRGEDCIVSIADNGPGIPEDELERIFGAFHRLPKDRKIPGSGLGLYFTRNLVEQQGGEIWAESQPGKGSCFHVLLKLNSQESNPSGTN